jgi:hypothetical protein
MTLSAGTKLRRYEIRSKLGEGGMGQSLLHFESAILIGAELNPRPSCVTKAEANNQPTAIACHSQSYRCDQPTRRSSRLDHRSTLSLLWQRHNCNTCPHNSVYKRYGDRPKSLLLFASLFEALSFSLHLTDRYYPAPPGKDEIAVP